MTVLCADPECWAFGPGFVPDNGHWHERGRTYLPPRSVAAGGQGLVNEPRPRSVTVP